ncbi:MAG: TetR family transcriptional regulator [Ancrocorticia sp.]|uniref:TetR family transcriptional regulator n=1 Tax=Ancrocorticia sp. TaxID=2593684 RepID=UPI003F8F7EB2
MKTGDMDAPPIQGLRERKKFKTMRHVQAIAMELFLNDGFDNVTVEQVAEASGVSPRTVYRYFSTKEGLVLRDEYDDQVVAALTHFLREGLSPLDAADAVLEFVEDDHFVTDEPETRERIRLFLGNSSLRSAGYLRVDEVADELAATMVEVTGVSLIRARVTTSALCWALIGAIKTWHESATGPLLPYIKEALATMRGLTDV